MNRRDFLQGFAAIAVASPFAGIKQALGEQEIFTPTKHTLVPSGFLNIQAPLADIFLPHDGDEIMDIYLQSESGHTVYVGSGEPGSIIMMAHLAPWPFRLLCDKTGPDHALLMVRPREYHLVGSSKVVEKFGDNISLVARRFV